MKTAGDRYEALAQQEPDLHKRILLLEKAIEADEMEEMQMDQQDIAMSNTPSSQRVTLSPGRQVMKDLRMANDQGKSPQRFPLHGTQAAAAKRSQVASTPGGQMLGGMEQAKAAQRRDYLEHKDPNIVRRAQAARKEMEEPGEGMANETTPATLDHPVPIEGDVPGEVGTCPTCQSVPCCCPELSVPSSQRTSQAMSPGRRVLKELMEQKVLRERMARSQDPLPKY